MNIFPTSYLAPIIQFALYLQKKEVLVEVNENFQKQTYRNRCYIYGANGPLMLNIPLIKDRNHTPIKEKRISYDSNWQSIHWRSLEACYRASPYFEFYEEEFMTFYNKKFNFLLDFNEALEGKIKESLKLDFQKTPTEKYIPLPSEENLRLQIHPKKEEIWKNVEFPKYIQVFESKFGFIKNLSIIDLIFNEGPSAKDYLENIDIPQERLK